MRYTAIDIGTSAVKSVLVEAGEGETKLLRYAVVPIDRQSKEPDGEAIVSALEEALKRTREKSYVLSIPRSSVVIREVGNLPRARDEASLKSAVAMQVASELPFPIDEATWDTQNMTESEGRISLQFVAAPSREVQRYMGYLERADVKPDYLFPSVFATTVLVSKATDTSQSPVVFLDIGAGRTDMGVVLADRMVFSRSLPIGGDSLTDSIARNLDVSFSEAEELKRSYAYLPSSELSLPAESEPLETETEESERDIRREEIADATRKWAARFSVEVDRSIQAFVSNMIGGTRSQPSRILICGGGSRVPGLVQYLREKLDVEVQKWDPTESVNVSEPVGDDGDLLALPLSLAMVTVSGVSIANLIPKEEKERRQRRQALTRIITYASAAVLGIALLTGALTIWDRSLDSRLAAINAELTAMQGNTEKSRSLLLKNLAMYDLMQPKVNPLDVLAELSELLQDRTKVALTGFNLDKTGKVTINVEARDHVAVSEMISALSSSPLFENVTQGQISTVEKDKNPIIQVAVNFTISPKAIDIINKSPIDTNGNQMADAGRQN